VTSVAGYQRQQQILNSVLRSRFVTARDLAARFEVSYSTISRDLDALGRRTDLRRVRGGLMYLAARSG
jgi:DeoR/GlpR family transcriptional regulator of sugar metabolism